MSRLSFTDKVTALFATPGLLADQRRELGERAWAHLLPENLSYPKGREAAIWWRCVDAGYEEGE